MKAESGAPGAPPRGSLALLRSAGRLLGGTLSRARAEPAAEEAMDIRRAFVDGDDEERLTIDRLQSGSRRQVQE